MQKIVTGASSAELEVKSLQAEWTSGKYVH